ncbi:MAG TPA: GNAT family N-acetyltransferase [Candidatus Cybelea sp.]|jgi:ribosomal-protein-alanine N-acetyltransferase|nr:GNAT family N-acetyltransferase [Candidatus Cybelea sp.]
MRTIRTARLRLVPVTAANAGLLWEVLQEPDLRDYQDLPDMNRAQFLRAVGARPTRLAAGVAGRFEWIVQFLDGPQPLGWVSLRIAESDRSNGEIGYSVVRGHRGQGIASEAVAALVEEGFRRAQVRRIRAYCLPENLASRAVLRRNGFDDEGMLTRGATVAGKTVDVILHTIDRERWVAGVTLNRQATRS